MQSACMQAHCCTKINDDRISLMKFYSVSFRHDSHPARRFFRASPSVRFTFLNVQGRVGFELGIYYSR
jgi:hypothetical protein